uniref:Glycosyl transferase family 28 C-terminal domain-containing protein n=1 Tax=Arcella intermedia TaxID=1963864 RepID=A0A6B2LI55_9EUKA
MPVPKTTILEIVTKIARKCDSHPAVIALVGNRDFSAEKIPEKVEQRAKDMEEEGLILVEKGAPFGKLFPLLDTIIIHGGLGTTAEALRVGVPVIVTGVLLMDQRFWGKRVHDLGFGPEPIHITDFKSNCVALLNEALNDCSKFRFLAEKKAQELFPSEDGDGVEENVETCIKFIEEATGQKGKFVFSAVD